jgi:hypothetical protein
MFCLYLNTFSQEPLNHEKKVYTSPDNKLFVNKSSPIYFKISLSPDANAPTYVMPSEETPKYANPTYLDSEGKNTLRSPSAIDPVTKKMIQPKQDVIFDVYADGIAPTTKIQIKGAERYVKNNIVFFGKGMQVSLASADGVGAGVEATYISLDKSSYQNVAGWQGVFDQEKEYFINYYSVDNVGNAETPRTVAFRTDYTAPQTSLKVIGESKGKVLSSKAAIALSSTDTLSGVKHIMYSINEGAEKVYSSPIPLSVLKDGASKINYYAVDNVGNKEEKKVIATSTETNPENGGDMSGYSFYIDKEAPVMSFEIEGDQYKGKSLYISERSRFKIVVTDEKSGVAKVDYSINNPSLKETYTEPFEIKKEGVNTVAYASTDNVGNVALSKNQEVYMDRSLPHSKMNYSGKRFVNRDTSFITNQTQIVISASETGSGLQSINYTLDNGTQTVYTSPFTVENEGVHTLDYYAVDNVNNTEKTKNAYFVVDNSSPKISYNFSVKSIGEKTVRDSKYVIYPSNVILYVAATDNTSGVERLEYQINGGKPQSLLPITGFVTGNYDILVTVYDALKNKSQETIRFAVEE